MTRRAQSSKRRWIARAKAGKWVPKEVVFHLDREQDWHERWEPHPTERGFMRLRRSAKVAWVEKESPMKSMKAPILTDFSGSVEDCGGCGG